MKIAQIVSTPPFAWTTGGPARVVFEISSDLVRKQHEVTIVTTTMFRDDISYNQELVRDSINGINFKCFDNLSRIFAWRYKLYLSIGLIRYLKNHVRDFDIVHLHDLISFHAIATAFFCRKKGVPYILSPHGCINWFFEKKILNKIFYYGFGKKILENAKIITILHQSEAEEFARLGSLSRKCIAVPNGIDPTPFENASRAGEFRRKFHIRSRERIVLYLGRINRVKGIELLIQAFSDLPKGSDVRLIIAGRDEGYLPELNSLSDHLGISQKVLFTGPLPEQEKIDAYIDADIFVLPSVHEGFGITVFEAFASRTPVIITKSCHISDSIKDSAIVIENNREQLKSALEKLLTDTQARDELIAKGRDLIKKRYSWETVTRQYEVIYQDVLKQNVNVEG